MVGSEGPVASTRSPPFRDTNDAILLPGGAPFSACLPACLPACRSVSLSVSQEDQPPKVVGYVLGKMEGSKEDILETQNQLNTAIPGWSTRGPRDRVISSSSGGGSLPAPRTGHVTSLAVLHGYRRCGAAKQLMDMLHDRVSCLLGVVVLQLPMDVCMYMAGVARSCVAWVKLGVVDSGVGA